MAGKRANSTVTSPTTGLDEAFPPRQPMIMLAVRFVLELVAFGGIGLAGWRIGDDGVSGGVLASMFVLAAAVLWGTCSVRDDPTRNPKPVVAIRGWMRLLIEFSVFGVAAWSLWVFASRAASETFLTMLGIVTLVGWDRHWWLLRQR
ncbi:MAG: YrdB family protein [Chloroflexota bacterium]|nr:YrdB family protein [Chloroflexota bacterium]